MGDLLGTSLAVGVGLVIGLALTFPRFRSMRRRSLGRIYDRELTRDGATYSLRLRKGEGIWRPGENGRVFGPAFAAYRREDRPEGVTYHLVITADDGSVTEYAGPIAPAFVEGSEAQARFRRTKKQAPVVVLVFVVLRLGALAAGIVTARVCARAWDVPWWAWLAIALAVSWVLEQALVRGFLGALKAVARRRPASRGA